MSGAAVTPRVNDVELAAAGEALGEEELRQRACTELLRQAAIGAGLLAADDPPPAGGAFSEAASAAIEALLDRELAVPEPDEQACRRHHHRTVATADNSLPQPTTAIPAMGLAFGLHRSCTVDL